MGSLDFVIGVHLFVQLSALPTFIPDEKANEEDNSAYNTAHDDPGGRRTNAFFHSRSDLFSGTIVYGFRTTSTSCGVSGVILGIRVVLFWISSICLGISRVNCACIGIHVLFNNTSILDCGGRYRSACLAFLLYEAV